ncbi:MAG: GNAT family N-acetyltransferase [Acidimicrobiales bacterium]
MAAQRLQYDLRRVPAEATFALRQKVLRPHQSPAEMALDGDDDPGTGFFAALDAAGEVVSTANIRREEPPPELTEVVPTAGGGEAASWRLRGMATREDLRSSGLGSRLVIDCMEWVENHGGGFCWCSARTPARDFYERAGFTAHGEVYEKPAIGPHVLMWRLVGEREQ